MRIDLIYILILKYSLLAAVPELKGITLEWDERLACPRPLKKRLTDLLRAVFKEFA